MNSKFFIKNIFIKNVFTLLSGTVIAQAIPILISSVLTRIYTPKELGVYAIFFATTNILSIFTSGRLEQAILIPKHRSDSFNIVQLALCYAVFISTILFFILLIFKSSIATFLGLSSLSSYILLIPLTSIFIVFFHVYSYWLNRNDNYTAISKGKIFQGVITGFIHVSASMLGSLGLVLGRCFGLLISSGYIMYTSLKKSPRLSSIKSATLKNTLKKYKSYPMFTMPNALLNSMSNNLPLYMLENLYSAKITGFYSWSVRMVQGPMGMLIASLQQVYFREASKKYNAGQSIYSMTKKLIYKLFLIGLIPYTIIYFFAPEIFAFVFGDEWRIAGEYTTYLVPWFFVVFLTSPVSAIILILEKQKIYFLYELLLFTARFFALYFGYYLLNEPKYSIILYGVVGFIFNITLLVIILNLVKQKAT